MKEAVIVPVKYLYLDVVSFTNNRSVEAQAEIVESLNRIVTNALLKNNIPKEDTILLPTGDGMCIGLLKTESSVDVHMRLGCGILEGLKRYNDLSGDAMRRFEVRIGINKNIDNLVTDINGNRNVAGAGINLAARVMSMADGNQILVSHLVFEKLRDRQAYMDMFRPFIGRVKHNVSLNVYQFIRADQPGLNTDIPGEFQVPTPVVPELDRTVGYYFAHAIENYGRFISGAPFLNDRAIVIWLWFRASDSNANADRAPFDIPIYKTHGAPTATEDEELEYYNSLDWELLYICGTLIYDTYLEKYSDCFERDKYGLPVSPYINGIGRARLKQQFPQIWRQFELEKF
jgi:hypothetical protein